MTRPPTAAAIEELAQAALATLPPEFARHVKPVVIRVEEFPDAETEREFELESPFDLLGLYRGTPLLYKSVADPRPHLDMIFLYRRPILEFWCETGQPLADVVRHVLIHEIGHHFGFSDADMRRIERG